jgi:ribonucleoside-diphosphate reductase alpha chain
VREEYLQPFFLPSKESTLDNGYRHFRVVSAEPTTSADTYCVNEPIEHKAVFNGVLTGNCNEIALPSNEDYSFVCVLSSMNLVHWDRLKDSDDIFWATIFLDCINSEFISKAKKIPGLEKSVRFAQDFAALGLGACGLHTLFQQKMIPWESFQAHQLNNEIFARLDGESRRASTWLAEKRGCVKFTEGTGMRNATRIAIAPTKSTALLMGGVSEGINPDPAMTYTQASAGGDLLRVNALILSRMRERGAYKKSEFDSINAASGSIQHVSWLEDSEKEVFKTAFEINMESVIRMGSARQRYIDQGQSLNTYFSASEDPAWIAHIHRLAMLDERIKGLYYVYSTRTLKGASRECVACQ